MKFDFKNDPIDNFLKSIHLAQIKGIPEHNAMSLATVNSNNKPANRIVLLKGTDASGFTFFTNYEGRKGHELSENQNVAATFYWPHLDHQIRIEGYVEKLSVIESEAYFESRPRLSQIGAWASSQSKPIKSFEELENKIIDLTNQYKGQKIPRPPNWGGYRIKPLEIEFWFAKMGRLHERYIYHRETVNADWNRFLRSP